MPAYLPQYSPGLAVTYTAAEDIIGGRVVEIVGDRQIQHAVAGSVKTVGVAAQDVEAGETVTVYSGGVQRPVAAGAIAAGDRVSAATDGKVSTGGDAELGTALAAAEADEPAPIKFDR